MNKGNSNFILTIMKAFRSDRVQGTACFVPGPYAGFFCQGGKRAQGPYTFKYEATFIPTSYPGSLPTPGASGKTLVGAGHVTL